MEKFSPEREVLKKLKEDPNVSDDFKKGIELEIDNGETKYLFGDRECVVCGEPIEEGDRVTDDGKDHYDCWSREKNVNLEENL